MQSFDIVKKCEPSESFRVESIKSQFDLNIEKVQEKFKGSLDLPESWNIGIIYGASGTGKSTIAKELFPDDYINGFEYKEKSIIDDMPKGKTTEDIARAFNSVGFATVWSWLKPYSVLSNGEKMRVDLARSILEERDLIVFDEYTSVINREVAKTGSFAIQKTIRRLGKKFIAVACHSDIIEWLEPDWTFCTDTMEFDSGRCHRRPEIKIDIYRTKRHYWELFRKYHYLNTEIAAPAHCYTVFIGNTPVAFFACVHHPGKVTNMKRGHRLVVLPDYQGIGIGNYVHEYLANYYVENGFRYIGTFSNRLLLTGCQKNPRWKFLRAGRVKGSNKGSDFVKFNRTKSSARMTYTFEYIGDK